jgi:hypothetical protein
MKKILLLSLIPFFSFSQTQVGANIQSLKTGFGSSVSISADGSTVAVGSPAPALTSTLLPDDNTVRVFKNISGVWTQLGQDITSVGLTDLFGDQFGFSVALSDDGNTVVIGANVNDGNGADAGLVRVYRFISNSWTKIGQDILGEGKAHFNGQHVSISGDGNTIGASSPMIAVSGFRVTRSHVRVFRLLSNTWVKIGANINGEADNDQSGSSFELSYDGNVVAIGAEYNDGNGSNSGHTRVFKNVSGTWTQIGTDINGEAAEDKSGQSISLSADGNIVAIGASENDALGSNFGHIRVFKNVAGTWTQIGSDIDGEDTGRVGLRISLSADGNTLLSIGGGMKVFKNISGVWQKIATNPIPNSINLDLSKDGNNVIFGFPYLSNGGIVQVYNLSNTLSNNSYVLSNLSIYPNAVSDILNIKLGDNLSLEKVNVYNAIGQIVKTANTTSLTMNDLSKGTYFLEVITNQGKATKKIVVQ